MTKAKAQAVVTAITDAGYQATAVPLTDNGGNVTSWTVLAHSRTPVPINLVKNLQDNQTVTATVKDVTFT